MFFAVRSTNQFEEIGLWWKLTNSLQEIWPQFAKRTRTTTLSAQRPTPLSLQLVTERDAHWRGMIWLQKWAHNQQVRLVLIFEEISKQIGVHAWFGEIKIEPFLALLGAILVNVRFIQCHNIQWQQWLLNSRSIFNAESPLLLHHHSQYILEVTWSGQKNTFKWPNIDSEHVFLGLRGICIKKKFRFPSWALLVSFLGYVYD